MRRLVVLAIASCAFALFSWSPATAETPAGIEHVESMTVDLTVAPDGLLTVKEDIVYDFPSSRHGIFRDLVASEVYGKSGKYDRVYRIKVLRVSSPSGAPAQVKSSRQGRYLHLRIGNPNHTVTGTQRYTIEYTVRGAPTAYPNHDELYWDAVGLQWNVPIDRADVAVHMPGPVTKIACYTGPAGSGLPCDRSRKLRTGAIFGESDLASFEGVSVVVGVPKGVIQPEPQPILEKRWNLNDAFARRTDTLVPTALLLLLCVGGVFALVWRRGRDRRYVGSAVDQAMGNTSGEEEPMPLLHERAGPVEFVPPDGVRPGQIGVLADENANLLDVTATIIDLAVRGHLRISELPGTGMFHRKHDYELQLIDTAVDAKLLPYERQIMTALFKSGTTVSLSDLKYKFRTDLGKIRDAMYNDALAQGWFLHRPDKVRAAWVAAGIGAFLLGVGVTILLAAFTTYGLLGLAVAIGGFLLLAFARKMPARTARGSAMLSRIRGFRRLFDEGDEDLRSRFAEQHGIFSEYLPYAIVFGCTDRWARVFEGLDQEALGTTGWYAGHNGMLNAIVLANAMDDFGTVATGTMYASQPSSSGSSGFSGGFSGGGGGGGGGGSW
ncbi:MAG TPA: DUF2207 domain-containing protein [Acidimicrobiia bacterium]|nr:DUF2207 domain-containing protein [Acidimicrobiia bacterium]